VYSTQRDRQDMTNLIVAFRNFVNAPEKVNHLRRITDDTKIIDY
jgi:hypothetical protein